MPDILENEIKQDVQISQIPLKEGGISTSFENGNAIKSEQEINLTPKKESAAETILNPKIINVGGAGLYVVTGGTDSTTAGQIAGTQSTDIVLWAGNSVENRTEAPFRVNLQGDVTASSLTLSGFVVTSKGSFGGDGSDGVLSVPSGTTTIDLGNAAIVVKNYTSIAITGTGAIDFSNPNADGTIIILKSQGNVTLTSTATPLMDLRGIGGPVFGGGTGSGSGIIDETEHRGGNASNTTGGTAGAQLDSATRGLYLTSAVAVERRIIALACGSGGGAGAQGSALPEDGGGGGGGGSRSGAGGAGGNNASNGSAGGTAAGGGGGGGSSGSSVRTGGGGGGGAGSMGVILYNTLIANTGTIDNAGGAGGTGSTNAASGAQGGRGGGAFLIECAGSLNFTGTIYVRGSAGSNAGNAGGNTGGAGGASSGGYVGANTVFG